MANYNYYESVIFSSGHNFNVSRRVDQSYIGKPHWHPFVEILLGLTDGNLISVNFSKCCLNLNDILIVYPGDLHSIDACENNSVLVIQFSGEMLTILNQLNRNMALLSQYPFLKYNPTESHNDRLIMWLKEFCEYSETDLLFREVHMYSLLLLFFEELGNRCMRTKKENSAEVANAKNKTIKKMAKACLFISQNCKRALTLDDVADFMDISRSHFAHLFKEYTGTTFVNFLTEERIKRAKTLFSNSDAQIIDVAYDSGFSSVPSFNRAFKKVTGMSPSSYRQTMIQELE